MQLNTSLQPITQHCQQLVTEHITATSNLALAGPAHLTLAATNYSELTGQVNLVPIATCNSILPPTSH